MSSTKRGLAAGLVALLGVAIATPSMASEAEPLNVSSAGQPLQASAQAKLAVADTAKAVRFAQAPAAGASESKPFFKSGKGVAVAVLMVGGIAWALVSRSQDAVRSPAR